MEIIWTVVCGNLMKASEFRRYANPTLDMIRDYLRGEGYQTEPVKGFRITFICGEDGFDLWNGSNVVDLAQIPNYDLRTFKSALVKAYSHNYPIYMCLSREADAERDGLTTFASFVLVYQNKIRRPLGATWSVAWEITGELTYLTYSEIECLYQALKTTKLLHL